MWAHSSKAWTWCCHKSTLLYVNWRIVPYMCVWGGGGGGGVGVGGRRVCVWACVCVWWWICSLLKAVTCLMYDRGHSMGQETEWTNPQIQNGKLPEMTKNHIPKGKGEELIISSLEYSQINTWKCILHGLIHSGFYNTLCNTEEQRMWDSNIAFMAVVDYFFWTCNNYVYFL